MDSIKSELFLQKNAPDIRRRPEWKHKKRTKSLQQKLEAAGILFGCSLQSTLMGEEKPDEELMGKRKSSPRLSTTFIDVDISRMPGCGRNIHRSEKKIQSGMIHFSYTG